MAKHLQDWDVWYPQAGATGIPFARGRVDPTPVMLVHAAPPVLTVTVREFHDPDHPATRVARGVDLPATAQTPITRLTIHDGRILREDIWPTQGDIGVPVLLPGGEVGILRQWWNADDRLEWWWEVEFYNCCR